MATLTLWDPEAAYPDNSVHHRAPHNYVAPTDLHGRLEHTRNALASDCRLDRALYRLECCLLRSEFLNQGKQRLRQPPDPRRDIPQPPTTSPVDTTGALRLPTLTNFLAEHGPSDMNCKSFPLREHLL